MDLLQLLGAEVHRVPAVSSENRGHHNNQARIFAKSLDNAIWLGQFDGIACADTHYTTTGPEIWAQAGRKVDGFVCASGTGGAIAGVGRYLKEKSQGNTKVWLADVPGAVFDCCISSGRRLRDGVGNSVVEGAALFFSGVI